MRLRVIATDYDGTISLNCTLDETVREKIITARRRGIVVVLVTGRILSELRDVAGDLSFADGIVAENGAVVSLPNGQLRLLGRLPPIELLARLAEHGIEFKVGHCVVEMDAEYADTAISIIRILQLPLDRQSVLLQRYCRHSAFAPIKVSGHGSGYRVCGRRLGRHQPDECDHFIWRRDVIRPEFLQQRAPGDLQ